MTIGLVLTGGGARAAYQVGVLKGIAEILPRDLYNPFPIITGTSAGAINAMSIAGRPAIDMALIAPAEVPVIIGNGLYRSRGSISAIPFSTPTW